MQLNSSLASEITWDDAVDRWLLDKSEKVTLLCDLSAIKWLNQYLTGIPLCDITRTVVDVLAQKKISTGVTNATVNRTLAVLRAILIRSVTDWDWLPSAPRVRLLREPLRRVRYLSKSQAKRLLAELPPHLSLMAAFSLATGLRRGNVTGLLWSQVDIERRLAWVHPDQSKNRKAIAVPLNGDALRAIVMQIGKHREHVFTYNGDPVKQLSTAAWYKALKRAGIDDFRWHDLRHTWASWHVQNGTPLYVLQELGGWENSEMVRRYAHFSASHLAVYADGLASLMAA
jgi:integrase